MTALTSALSKLRERPLERQIEVATQLMDAAGALELLGAKPTLEVACSSQNVTLRRHAEHALGSLGDHERRCEAAPIAAALPAPSAPAAPPRARLELSTDVGPLAIVLDGVAAPFAVARVLELARAGFYDGQSVTRVVPGFVVQLGDPGEDGFGGADREPLRCQNGFARFDAGSVGVAIAGRDSGRSQLFLSLRRAPQLDPESTLLGHAEDSEAWQKLTVGDRITQVKVVE